MIIVEIPFSRESFGGNRRAINRHSTREYITSDGNHYLLDRTLDALPPFFTLYELPATSRRYVPRFGALVRVDGRDCWGDGLSWAAAERLTLQTIEAEED